MLEDLSEEEEKFVLAIDKDEMPKHVAIIMDGNGRWAKERGLPRIAGHEAGIKSAGKFSQAASQLGIQVLTLYAFSTENWARPKPEVNALMRFLRGYLKSEVSELMANGVVLRGIGRLGDLPKYVQRELARVTQKTRDNKGLILNLALSYGGRAEIIDAIRKLVPEIIEGKHELQDLDEEFFEGYLYTAGLPFPDLLIRTGGEMRVSNFLLWQLAYAEIWVTAIYWPDFKRVDLLRAIVDYQKRERRFGKIVGD